jgi:Zn finger protein HypA/HybF involved in hydrogenase expression
MANALRTADQDPLFRTHPKMTVRKGAYTYTIETRNGKTTYSVSDGVSTLSTPVRWAFGDKSQTYVLERNGQFYESLVSYFKTIDGLDTTVGDQRIEPVSVEQAFGRPLEKSEATLCFGCHSTGTVVNHELHLESFHPGVTCQHCHAQADEHLQAISHAKLQPIPPKLEDFSPEQISTFCGQCHRTWQTVMRNKWFGPMNVRFQPYRLELSKCFDGVDRRFSCIACHDPHQQVVRETKAYDAKCLACHSAGAKLSLGMISAHPEAKAMPVCPVAKSDCASCHMPKVDLPDGHDKYTDHNIRIVREGAPYPD